MVRVIVIGLDGATWELLQPWIDQKELPNMRYMVDLGVQANLISTIPPVTGPAWTSFSTGCNPGKHGIFDFIKLLNGKLSIHKSSDIQCSTFYEILSSNGFYSNIINLPLSFPPPASFRGIMISDFLYPKKTIIPQSKEKYLEEYEVFPYFSEKYFSEEMLDHMKKASVSQIKTAKKIFCNENWNFFFFLFSGTDHVSHFFWHEFNKNTSKGLKAKKIFKIADEFIGWILNKMEKNDILFVISDHGFGEIKYSINLNRFLQSLGLLKVKYDFKEKKYNSFLDFIEKTIGKNDYIIPIKSKFLRELLKIRYFQTFFSFILKHLKRIPSNFISEKLTLFIPYHEIIDFINSDAFIPTVETMGIFINKKRDIKQKLINILNRVKYNNIKVFKNVFDKEKIYFGEFKDFAPDILLIPNEFMIFSKLFKSSNEIFFPLNSAYHKMKGIFLAYGDEIKNGLKMKNCSIYDIAPTILHAFNIHIPSNMDGNVLKQIYKENSDKAKRPIKIDYDIEKIKKVIKDLGNSFKI